MATRHKHWLLAGFMILALALIVMFPSGKALPGSGAVTIILTGYTNFPGNLEPYAFFTVSNQTTGSIRWRDNWEEAEGSPDHWSRVIDPRFMDFCSYNPVLKPGESFVIAVGELTVTGDTYDADPNGHWRFSLSYVPDSLKERLVDYEFRHRMSFHLGSFELVDSQKVLNATNLTIYSPWLVKRKEPAR